MKKKTLTALCCLAFISPIFSQDSLLTSNHDRKNSYMGTPLIVIKGEEISRFPSNNFLDAVNGLYPWLFQENPAAARYTYVVNGNILQDINAISLYDIEEVSFSRGNLDGTIYPFSQAGVFYIKTKTTDSRKPVIRVHSQYNTIWNKDRTSIPDIYAVTESDRNNGHLHSHHVSVSMGDKKLRFYISGFGTGIREIGLAETGESANYTMINSQRSKHTGLGTYLHLTYQVSPALSAGISGNYFDHKAKRNYDNSLIFPPDLSHYDGTVENRVSYYHVSPYISWAPMKNLRNTLYFEYAGNRLRSESPSNGAVTSSGNPVVTQTIQFDMVPYLRGYLLRNHLEYDLTKGRLKTSIGAIFSYLNQEARDKQGIIVIENNMTTLVNNFFSYRRQKVTTLNPLLHFSYNDVFSGYAGHSFLLNKQSELEPHLTTHSRHSYYAGTVFNIKNMLRSKALQRLDLVFHYGDMTKNASDNYWLPGTSSNSFQFDLSSPLEGTIVSPSNNIKQRLQRNQLLSLQINSAFLNDRVQAGVEWSRLEQRNIYMVAVPLGGSMYREGKVIVKGISFYSAGKLIDKAKQQWNLRLNVLFPDREYEINASSFNVIEANYMMQAGLQNYFRFGGWYAQVNALAGLERKIYDYNNPQPKEPGSSTDIILNYIMVGYDLPVAAKSFFSKLSVFIHARNLFGTSKAKDYYAFDSFGGAGIQLQMN